MGEKPPPNRERLVEQQVEVVALDKVKDRVVVETAMRLDVAVAVLVVEGLGVGVFVSECRDAVSGVQGCVH